MDCTKCQECTKSFIDGNLPDNLVFEYYDHIEHCPSCKEDLVINYAIINALRSLNENRDLSSDFVKEVDDKLNASRNRIIREAKARRFRRVFAFLEIACIMVFASIFPPVEKNYAFLPEDSEERIVIEMYGVPTYMDPVMQAIYKYNSEVIRLLEEKAKEEREAAKKDKKTSGQEAEEQSEQDSGQADSFMPEAGDEPDEDDVTKGGTLFEDGESKDTSKAVKSDAKDISKPVSSKNVTDVKGEE